VATLQEILSKAGTLEKAEQMARFLSDDNPEYLMDLQLVLSAQNKLDEAWEVSNQATELFPDDHRVAFNRGWLVMQKGDLLNGFRLMDRGRYARIWGNSPLQSNKPIWDGKQDISGKTVLFYNEAGFGDEMVHVRFVKSLADRGARVIVAANSGLISLFARMEGVSAVIDKQAALAVYHDYWIPSMSAAKLCKIGYENLDGSPYLSPDPDYCAKWQKIIQSDKLKVGIRWSGNPRFEYDQHRSIPAEQMIKLANLPNVQIFSLQRDDDLIYLPDNIVDLQSLLKTWEDTAAAISQLDLVITSCTAIAHLAASMEKPTWVIVPIMPYYVWVLPGDTSPWYKSVRLFRQEIFGSWAEPFEEVKKTLKEYYNEKK